MISGQDIDALHGFIDESLESFRCIEPSLVALEKDSSNLEIVNQIFRPVHSIKGNSGFFGLTNVNRFAHRLENLLDYVRKGEILANKEVVDVLLAGFDNLKEMVVRIYDNPNDVALTEEDEQLLARIEKMAPKKFVGSINSIVTLEKLVNEAVAVGFDVKGNSIISTLLSHIEKSNAEIQLLISRHKASLIAPALSGDKAFSVKGVDFTSDVRCLHEVFSLLGQNRAVTGELLKRYEAGLKRITPVFSGNEALSQVLAELESMRGFLDDELLVTSAEYTAASRQLLEQLMAGFESDTSTEAHVPKVGEILVAKGLVTEEQLANALASQKKVGEILVAQGALAAEELQQALNEQGQQKILTRVQQSQAHREMAKTLRIDQDRLDDFATSVGELFICTDTLSTLGQYFETKGLDVEARKRLEQSVLVLDSAINKLHHDLMAIRRVPIKSLFQRFPRVVRELAASLGKEIDVVLSGDNTVVDKDLLEKIENPLVHLLRNSVDHGIEKPDARVAAGKKRSGTISVTAAADEDAMYLTIKDDGKGIDPQTMKAVAVTKGFMSQAEVEELSERELINLIFKPGFSSTDKVSDVSGRGVGMDVVSSAMRECGGAIDVDSRKGFGTTVSIRIPISKTLVTKDAIIVHTHGQTFAVVSDDVESVVDVGDDENRIFRADGRIMRMAYKEMLLGVVDVNAFFFPESGRTAVQNPVLLACPHHEVALLVDEVVNHQTIVQKSFDERYEQFRTLEGISGYTTLGNEEIVLIIDVGNLVECSRGCAPA